jgi:hypothetical protein
MTLIITPDMTPEDIHRHAREMRKNLKYDFKNLCGTISISENPLTIQKNMRNEWE